MVSASSAIARITGALSAGKSSLIWEHNMSVNSCKQHAFLISGKGTLKTCGWCWLRAEAFSRRHGNLEHLCGMFFFLLQGSPFLRSRRRELANQSLSSPFEFEKQARGKERCLVAAV